VSVTDRGAVVALLRPWLSCCLNVVAVHEEGWSIGGKKLKNQFCLAIVHMILLFTYIHDIKRYRYTQVTQTEGEG